MGGPSSMSSTNNVDTNTMRASLFRMAMKGDWNGVIQIYQKRTEAFTAKITKSGDTALHLAVLECQEETVQELISVMMSSENKEAALAALKAKNDRKNTPLHLAASLGSVAMCYYLAKEDASLVGEYNEELETPFFVAALDGRKQAFLYLHSVCDGKGSSYYRRRGGETILHVAIYGEYFDLACQIINLYGDLVNFVNEKGVSPLHILASKPNVFKSSSRIKGYGKIIYTCTFIERLKPEEIPNPQDLQTIRKNESVRYPENYQVCIQFLELAKEVALTVSKWIFTTFPTFVKMLYEEYCRCSLVYTESQQANKVERCQLLRCCYNIFFGFIKLFSKAMLIVLGFGITEVEKIKKKKQTHTWSAQIMDQLLPESDMYEYEDSGKRPPSSTIENDIDQVVHQMITAEKNEQKQGDSDFLTDQKQDASDFLTDQKQGASDFLTDQKQGATNFLREEKQSTTVIKETPILIAAKNGITEIVEKILELFPVAIHDTNPEKKNIVLLAAEHKQPHVYLLLLQAKFVKDTIFRSVDKDGNSALHLAAKLSHNKPWSIPGAALQMQWELKWYEFVKTSMPHHFFARYNNDGKTAKELFTESHSELAKSGGEWLTNTSESCSVVAALNAAVAFATSAAIPGGTREENGAPILEKQPAFNIFAVSSLVALSFSVTAMIMFLAILTSRYQEKDFGKSLPRKLLFGMTSLFVSVAAILLCFCAGHFFVLRDELKFAAFPIYAVTCLPVTYFAVAQFPLYFDVAWAIIRKVPQRSYMVTPP